MAINYTNPEDVAQITEMSGKGAVEADIIEAVRAAGGKADLSVVAGAINSLAAKESSSKEAGTKMQDAKEVKAPDSTPKVESKGRNSSKAASRG